MITFVVSAIDQLDKWGAPEVWSSMSRTFGWHQEVALVVKMKVLVEIPPLMSILSLDVDCDFLPVTFYFFAVPSRSFLYRS